MVSIHVRRQCFLAGPVLKLGRAMRDFRKSLKILVALLGPLGLALLVGYLWDEGYLGFHWEVRDSIYDPKLGIYRCLDETGQLEDKLNPPCLVMTLRGLKAKERREKQCRKTGGEMEACSVESYEWLLSKQPRGK